MAPASKDMAKDIPVEEALDHVLGYTCFGDVTERELAGAPGQLTRIKGSDTFAPFGPCTATDLDPFGLVVRTHLNGTPVQEGEIRNCVFSLFFMVHYLSQCMTLLPEELTSTGTPRGIGAMKPGDVVEVTIEGVVTLRDPVKLSG